jgi:hypothetical protein
MFDTPAEFPQGHTKVVLPAATTRDMCLWISHGEHLLDQRALGLDRLSVV